jgi:hypothetical protein
MSPMRKVKEVRALPGFQLEVVFDTGETRYFDVTPYLGKGIFKALADEAYFRQVQVKFDGVAWPQEQDLSPDTLYLLGRPERLAA